MNELRRPLIELRRRFCGGFKEVLWRDLALRELRRRFCEVLRGGFVARRRRFCGDCSIGKEVLLRDLALRDCIVKLRRRLFNREGGFVARLGTS